MRPFRIALAQVELEVESPDVSSVERVSPGEFPDGYGVDDMNSDFTYLPHGAGGSFPSQANDEGGICNGFDSPHDTLNEDAGKCAFMNKFPIQKSAAHHWSVKGEGNRWECADYATAGGSTGYQHSTNHQVWVEFSE